MNELWKKRLWKLFCSSSVLLIAFILGTLTLLPLFDDRKELFFAQVNQETVESTNTQLVDTGAYIHYYAPDGSFGATHIKEINWSYWKSWLNSMFDWRLRASTDGDNWVNANQGLTVDLNWSEENNTCKVSLILNTSEAPVPLFYNFDLLVNSSIKSYVNKSSNYEYYLELPCNNTENESYNMFFNWSDLIPLVQSNKITVTKGVTNITGVDSFYFRIFTVNKINPDIEFVVDPSFGYTTAGASTRRCDDMNVGSPFICPSSGVAKNITVRLNGGDFTGEPVTCGIFNNATNVLVGQTEEKNIVSGTWYTFNFTSDVYILEGVEYLLTVWADYQGSQLNVRATSGMDWFRRDDANFGGLSGVMPDPFVEAGTNTYQVSIYCNYDENTSCGTDTSMSNFSYYKKITINSSLVDCDLTNFPILVHNTSSNFSDHARPDGYDFVFMNYTNETKYNHEIERFDNDTGELWAWVNITDLNSSTDTELWLWYGNGTTGTQENVEDTWDSDFVGVWHLGESGTGLRYDSSNNDRDGTTNNYDNDEDSTGKIGNCDEFDGTDDYLNFTQFSRISSADATYEFWLEPDSVSGNLMFSGRNDNDNYFDVMNNDLRVQNDGSNNLDWLHNNFVADTWLYCVVVKDATNYESFSDGVSDGTRSGGGAVGLNTAMIGNGYTGTTYVFDGKIDEVRFSDIVRSDCWLLTSFNTVNDSENFITVGTEQEPTTPSGEDWNSIATWNITLVNDTLSWQQINDWNITLVNETLAWNQIVDWNITISNTSSWTQVNDWNITISNTSSWTQVNDWNITLVNDTLAWNQISDWNITIVNSSAISWTQVNDWNITLVNDTLAWNQITDWNITLVNSSPAESWQQIQNWNITLSNSTSLNQIQNWNITLVNATEVWEEIQDWNITIVNSSVFTVQISNVFPSNSSLGIHLQPTLYATVNQTNGQQMNISWFYGNSLGACSSPLSSASLILNSTQTSLHFPANSYVNDYYFRIQLDDGNDFVNESFTFRTTGQGGGGGGQIQGDSGAMGIALMGLLLSLVAIMFFILRRKRNG